MATIYAEINGISFLRENPGGGTGGIALISFELPAYTASSDNVQIGGGGKDRGASTSDSLATILQKQRRDGKTVTIGNPAATNTSVAICAESGKQGSTEFWVGGFAISSGSVTCNLTNTSGTEIDAASGVRDRAITVAVSYKLS